MSISIFIPKKKPILSQKSKNLKVDSDFWNGKTSPILYKIMTQYYTSIEYNLNNFLERCGKQSDVSNAIRRLVHEDILIRIKYKQRGKNSTSKPSEHDEKRTDVFYYVLTPKGVGILIDGIHTFPEKKECQTLKDYWKTLIEIFMKNKINGLEKLRDLSQEYETKILKIQKEILIPIRFKEITFNPNDEIVLDSPNEYDKFLEIVLRKIGMGNPLSKKQISKVAEVNNLTTEEHMLEPNQEINRFYKQGFLTKSDDETYDLSVIGLIRLFGYLYLEIENKYYDSESSWIVNLLKIKSSSNNQMIKIFNKNFDTLRKKYVELLPDLLSDKIYPKLTLSRFEFLVLLMKSVKMDIRPLKSLLGDRRNEFVETMENYELFRQEQYYDRFYPYLGELHKFLEDSNIEDHLNPNIVLHVDSTLALMEEDDMIEISDESGFRDISIPRKSIERKLTFGFYLHYKYYKKEWNDKLTKMIKPNIINEYENHCNELLDFVEDINKKIKQELERSN